MNINCDHDEALVTYDEASECPMCDLEKLFDAQRRRMGVAQEKWWASGNDRNVYPDLGELLGWLCGQIDELRQRAESAEGALSYIHECDGECHR